LTVYTNTALAGHFEINMRPVQLPFRNTNDHRFHAIHRLVISYILGTVRPNTNLVAK